MHVFEVQITKYTCFWCSEYNNNYLFLMLRFKNTQKACFWGSENKELRNTYFLMPRIQKIHVFNG